MTERKRPTNSPQRCPACQQLKPGFKADAGAGNSLSRYSDIYICSDCGLREALLGFFWRDRCPADRIKPHHR
jgi:rubrerythrin